MTSTLTLYSDFGHVVKEIDPDENPVNSFRLPGSVIPSSIVLTDETGSSVSFIYHPTSSVEVMTKHIPATVTKGDRTITGDVISVNDKTAILLVNNGLVQIREFDYIQYRSPKIYHPNPTIAPHSELSDGGSISYLTRDVGWVCSAAIYLQADQLDLQLNGQIFMNDSALKYGYGITKFSNVYLVSAAGISKPMDSPVMYQARKMDYVDPTLSEDYVRYEIGPQFMGPAFSVPLGNQTYPINKIYQHSTDQPSVRFGYQFVATDFIPSCSATVYNQDSYIGSTSIGERQAGDDVTVLLGESTLIQAKTTVSETTESKDDHESVTHQQISTEIVNHQSDPITFLLRHPVGRYSIQTDCPSFVRRGNYLEWSMEVSPMEPHTFRCVLTLNA